MTDSFYNDAGPFTMVSHLLAQEVGLVCAAVYGAVWKKCQLEDGVCKASLDTLGSEIHLDRATVMRSIKKLCELGYLLDQTPDRRNAPHTYTMARSVALCNTSDDTGVVMRNSPEAETVAENNKSVAHNNSSIGDEAQGDKTVAESHLKRVSSNPLESLTDNLDSSPNGEGDAALKVNPENEPQPARPPPRPEYTPFLRKFLAYFNAKRFRNPTQTQTITGLVEKHGEAEVDTLAGWAANKGMGLGQAVPAIKSALENPKRVKGQATNGHHGTYQRSDKRSIKALEQTGESLANEPTFNPYTGETIPGRGS